MTALRLDEVAIAFGGVRAVDGVSLEIPEGERRVLLGPNGAGKTTLFNLIGGQLRPTHGRIELFGRDVTSLAPDRRADAGLARTFQITNLFPSLTVAENIHLAVQGLSPHRLGMIRAAERYRGTVERVEALLEEWRFAGERATRVRELSYGEQRKLEIAMALAQRPRLLLLDEPTAGLSAAETQNVVGVIAGLSRDVTIVVVEHDMDVAFEIGDRFTVLYNGRILAEGGAAELRANAEVQAIYFGEFA
jgi:branched-chain amino acid transport system ATP-binding protein